MFIFSNVTILVPLWFIIIPLGFSYISKRLFLGFLLFKGTGMLVHTTQNTIAPPFLFLLLCYDTTCDKHPHSMLTSHGQVTNIRTLLGERKGGVSSLGESCCFMRARGGGGGVLLSSS